MPRVGVGIVGTGWGVRAQLPGFRAAGLEVLGLAGRDRAKTARIARELEIPFHSDDFRALLARPEIAIVSITTPPALHSEMAVAALEAGKHVLCEKPAALHVGEAAAMVRAAAARPGQLALIDHELRFLPAIRLARRLVAEGAIGRVGHAELRMVSAWRAVPHRPWTWWADDTRGGGLLRALGSHGVDLLRFVLSDEVTAVGGALRSLIHDRPDERGAPRPVTADDCFGALLRFGRGAIATITASAAAPLTEPTQLSIFGSAGALRFVDGRLLRADVGGDFVAIGADEARGPRDAVGSDFARATIYLGRALRAWLDGDRAALQPAATFADGLAVQRVIDGIRAATLRPVAETASA